MVEESYLETRRKDLTAALTDIEGKLRGFTEAHHRITGALVELGEITKKVIEDNQAKQEQPDETA